MGHEVTNWRLNQYVVRLLHMVVLNLTVFEKNQGFTNKAAVNTNTHISLSHAVLKVTNEEKRQPAVLPAISLCTHAVKIQFKEDTLKTRCIIQH